MTVNAPQLLTQSLENSLNALARELRVVRDGPPVVQPGQSVTVSLLPIAAELDVTNVANPLVGLLGALTGNVTGSLGNLVADLGPVARDVRAGDEANSLNFIGSPEKVRC